jgi:hypothetical protein
VWKSKVTKRSWRACRWSDGERGSKGLGRLPAHDACLAGALYERNGPEVLGVRSHAILGALTDTEESVSYLGRGLGRLTRSCRLSTTSRFGYQCCSCLGFRRARWHYGITQRLQRESPAHAQGYNRL